MGGPDSLEAIQPFLENLFSDPEILKFPLSRFVQKPLARMISRKRSEKVMGEYRKMGGKSPLVEITAAQAKALQQALGDNFSVHVAMRYWHPRAIETVAEVRAAHPGGPERIVVLPLYPHYCRATTGTSITDLDEALERGGLGEVERIVVSSWQDYAPYVDALAECVAEVVADNPSSLILFSAHSIPVSLVEGGDPYLDHIKATVAGVMKRFSGNEHRLAFQSRAGPVRWLEPSMEDAIKRLAAEGVEDVTVVAVSFVSDHIETLCEIDEQYREMAEGLGIKRFKRAPSLNVRPSFVQALESLVRHALDEGA
jgi:ferrochelatase